ncbi:hypothetical protein AUJ68_02445 [Candidatus Woesearchaeota archaeon CG1_02_57_44]|nr:MAG: hypothetical protein AUJ68_02445 [Candidatus Woesearchaeota archaeon CG1_02_57_44]
MEDPGSILVIRLSKGDNLIDSVQRILHMEKIKAGYFTAIGAVDWIDLGHYDVEEKKYTSKQLEAPLEIASCSGMVTGFKGGHVHAHIVVTDKEMRAFGGHLNEARVGATCEIVLKPIDAAFTRTYNDGVGLNLLTI